MIQTKGSILFTLCYLIITPCKIYGQNEDGNEYTRSQLTSAAREIIDSSGTCTLITLDDEFLPMVRIMDPFPPESDFTVWFGTNSRSRKVNQIKNNPNVTLYYQDTDISGYVVIHGTAQIIDDPKEKQKRWKDSWEDFYPNNREAYLLIKVTPDWMEILSVSRGITGDSKTWRTPIVRFD